MWASGAQATRRGPEGVLPEQSLGSALPLLHILRKEEPFYWLFPSPFIHAKAETQRG